MSIARLNLQDAFTAEELWVMQHAAYRLEASLIGVPDLPPLRDTIHTLQTCGETFYGYRTDDGELVGAVSIGEEPGGKIAICRMMVHPDHHRKGIGSRLLQHVLSEVPGGTEVSVTAEERNIPAVKLYERNGFEAQGIFKPAPHITMVRFIKPLP